MTAYCYNSSAVPKIHHPYRPKHLVIILVLFVLLIVPSSVCAAAISKSYRVDGNPTKGNLVSLDTKQPGTAHLATMDNSSGLLGVVVGQGDSLLAINPDDNLVQVAIDGEAPVLVSTSNGDIAKGDLISVSPLSGLGMDAEAGLPVIGRALTAFSADSSQAVAQQVTDKNGKTTTVKIGFVNVDINVNTSTDTSSSLNALQRLVKSLTGHVIPTARIIVALAVALVTLVVLTILIYASIFGSIMSIGRNPLAKSSILRALRSVLLLALLLAVVAGVAMVLLLS